MKKLKNSLKIAIFSLLIMTNLTYANSGESINILFTHDLHDHIESYDILENNKTIDIGGYERLNNSIQKQKSIDNDTLVLDAGDYSMGTLFQTIYTTEIPSLKLLGSMDFDATTLGNHEFDFRTKGLTKSLNAAMNSNVKLPELLVSNIDFENYDNVDKKDVDDLKLAFDKYNVKDYLVLEKKGYKVGIFGLMGYDSISNAPMAGVNFSDPIDTAIRVSKILKEDEKVDLIICLSHSGTEDNLKKSEDVIMAEKVKDIDIIISGHSHTTLEKPITINNTTIVSSGSYGKYLGKLQVKENNNKWEVKNYELELLDKDVENKKLNDTISLFKEKVQREYLDTFDLEYNQVIGYSNHNFSNVEILDEEHNEDTLPNLITDSYRYMVKSIEKENYKPITASIVPSGTVRGSIVKGNITTSDVFNISSLGIGPDEISGYPLIDVYLTGKELKTAAEVDASIQPIMSAAQLYISGVNYKFNPNRLIFNKVTDIYILNEDGKKEKIDDEKLYRIVTGLYTAQMLSVVEDKSFGIMSLVPKDEDGNEITDFEGRIIYDGDKEVKEWYALAKYIQSFDENEEGVPEIPEKYSLPEGRKIVDNSSGLKSFFEKPNTIAKIIYSIIVLILLLIVLIVKFIIKKLKKKNIKK